METCGSYSITTNHNTYSMAYKSNKYKSISISIAPLKLLLIFSFLLLLVILLVNYKYHVIRSTEIINNPEVVNNINTNTDSNTIDSNIPSNNDNKKKIAYAITVTKDGSFVDGALVLGYSIIKSHKISKYNAELIAFVVSNVQTSRPILQAYGWKVIEKKLPVELDEIENVKYAERMKDSGCCGADEFLKLWAFTLTEYHRVVHLDMDSVVFQNMDELYDIDKEMLYTGDYGMKGDSPVPPAQGGFLVVRPSLTTFSKFQEIIRKGDHSSSSGWGNTHIGNFWGGTTIQGIIPYYYYSIDPNNSYELNRCVYNCMVDNPYHKNTFNCLNNQPKCEDCRLQRIENVKSAHFTICQKPWTCTEHTNIKNKDLCEKLHKKWFELRNELEIETKVDISYRQTSRYKDSLGMCRRYGDHAYLPIPLTLIDK